MLPGVGNYRCFANWLASPSGGTNLGRPLKQIGLSRTRRPWPHLAFEMAGWFVTEHAGRRLAERSIQLRDTDLIALIGTEVSDGFLVRDEDCEAVEHQIKQVLDRMRRLRGKRLVVVDGSIITG